TIPPASRTTPLSLHDALPISEKNPHRGVTDRLLRDRPEKLIVCSTDRIDLVLPAVADHIQIDNQGNLFQRDHRMVRKIVGTDQRSEEHTSELQSRENLVCRLL